MSFILSQIIRKKIPNWNGKVFTENDFYALCRIEKVRVMESPLFKNKGEYSIHEEIPFILLNSKLKPEEKLWVAFHEIGHHFLHFPFNHKFSKSIFRRMDKEANFFAAIALIPSELVLTKTLGEITEDYNYPKELIIIRKEIWDIYKI